MFSKKDRANYDAEILLIKKRLVDLESQLEYFKFKEETPCGIKVSVDSTLYHDNASNVAYQWRPTLDLTTSWMYTVTATWCDPKKYKVLTQGIIRCYGRPLYVRTSSFNNGVISLSFSVHKIDGEYTVKWNTNSKTFKVFHNGVEIPFIPNIEDGKLIFKYC